MSMRVSRLSLYCQSKVIFRLNDENEMITTQMCVTMYLSVQKCYFARGRNKIVQRRFKLGADMVTVRLRTTKRNVSCIFCSERRSLQLFHTPLASSSFIALQMCFSFMTAALGDKLIMQRILCISFRKRGLNSENICCACSSRSSRLLSKNVEFKTQRNVITM